MVHGRDAVVVVFLKHGKSTTHKAAHSLVYIFKSAATLQRSAPKASHTILRLSAPKNTISPFCAPSFAMIFRVLSSPMNLIMGDCKPSTPFSFVDFNPSQAFGAVDADKLGVVVDLFTAPALRHLVLSRQQRDLSGLWQGLQML